MEYPSLKSNHGQSFSTEGLGAKTMSNKALKHQRSCFILLPKGRVMPCARSIVLVLFYCLEEIYLMFVKTKILLGIMNPLSGKTQSM